MDKNNTIITKTDEIEHSFLLKLQEIKESSDIHYHLFKQLKWTYLIITSIITFLNSISVTSIALFFSGQQWVLVTCLATNSISSLLTAVLSVWSIEDKYFSHQTSYLQFRDVLNMYQTKFIRSRLDTNKLLDLMDELDAKLSIILDNCEPINRVK